MNKLIWCLWFDACADTSQENLPATPDSRAKSTEHVLRQAKLSRELQELNQILAKKQELANKMNRSEEEMASVRNHYEVNLFLLLVL